MPHRHLSTLDEYMQQAGQTPLAAFRDCLKAGSSELVTQFQQGVDVTELVRARADFIDQLLNRAWQQHVPAEAPLALIAVGGYGRRELHPASDIDLMILTGEDAGGHEEAIEQLLMFLWDIGLEVGHSVRGIADCVREAERDLTIITNLIEARLLCGRGALFEAMQTAIGPDRIWPSEAFYHAKVEEQRARHLKHDDTGYNLEPNIKESPGGLRDIQTIAWVAKRHFGAETMRDLIAPGFLTECEYRDLMAGQAKLWRIRFALHLLTGRHEDRLLFDHQPTLAAELGTEPTEAGGHAAIEQFMQSYYRTVMQLNRINEMLLQFFAEAFLERGANAEPTPINRRFQARDGYLEATNNGIFARNPLSLMELFLLLQQHPELKGVRASTIRLIRAHRHLIDQRFRQDLRSRSLFMEILRQPQGVTDVLRRMNRYGILARYIPAFGNIVGRMQYDLFHVYTVDEHTLTLIRNLRRFSLTDHQHEFPLAFRVFQTLPKPELLYLAGLFHDIAKGRGGDHSQLGAHDAWNFCKLHDLSDADTDLVAWLVRKHLVMSMTAQRKDIDDPEVIQQFAAEIGDPVRLDYLYLLTIADMRATSPKRWNSWKGSLLAQLYNSTRQSLLRGLDRPECADHQIQDRETAARRLLREKGFSDQSITQFWMSLGVDYFLHSNPQEIAWQSGLVLAHSDYRQPIVEIHKDAKRGASEIFICVQDREKLFAHTTALLADLDLNVLEARVQTSDTGCTLNTYFVLEANSEQIAPGARTEEVIRTLHAGIAAPGEFHAIAPRRLSRRLKHFDAPASIVFSQDASQQRTVLRLRATDHTGLLSQVGQAFAECNVRVCNAKIATLGATAEDTFFITDQQDAPIKDPLRLQQLMDSIRNHLQVG